MDDVPSFDLSGQVALVTGAGRGLGRAIALALADAGADVALGLRDAGADGGLAERIAGLGRRALRLQMDVTDLAQSRAAIDRAAAELGGLDILVNNAGGGIDGVALDVTEADFDAVVALNVQVDVLPLAARRARDDRAGPGRADRQPQLAGRGGGAARRAGLLPRQGRGLASDPLPGGGMGRARHHGERGRADLHRDAGYRRGPGDAAFKADTIARIAALHRIGKPVEVAGAVVFLASPAASLVTGHTLVIDGGWTVR